MSIKRIVLLVVSLLVALVIGISVFRSAEQAKHRKALGALQADVLKERGWHDTTKRRLAEAEDLVPALVDQLKAAKDANAKLLTTTRTVTKTEYFEIPTNCSESSPSEPSAGPGGASPSPAQPTLSVGLEVDSQMAFSGLANGKILATHKLFGRMVLGTRWDSGWRELTPDQVKSSTAIGPELARAWQRVTFEPPRVALAIRPMAYWRGGWGCVGGGTYMALPALPPGPSSVGLGFTCGWGPQF